MPNLGPWEIIAILAVLTLLFGAKKLPELARGAGQGLRIFKSEIKGDGTDGEADNSGKPQALESTTTSTTADVPQKKTEPPISD
jgi:sec-independent protein translocase protein TatA